MNEHLDDTKRIQRALTELNEPCSMRMAYLFWRDYSENNWCAGWICLPNSDEELKEDIKGYLSSDKWRSE